MRYKKLALIFSYITTFQGTQQYGFKRLTFSLTSINMEYTMIYLSNFKCVLKCGCGNTRSLFFQSVKIKH